MLKNNVLKHAPDIPSGGECIWGGKGSHSPATAVKSWMNSPPHKALILSPKIKSHAVAIVWGKNGTYATWRGSTSLPIADKPHKPPKAHIKTVTVKRILSLNTSKIVLSIVLGMIGVLGVAIGIHGLYVYFNKLDALLGEGSKFLLMIDVPKELSGLVLWATARGLQSWFIPAVILTSGILIFNYSHLWSLMKNFFNRIR